jgi:hypothetical protein
MAEPKNIADMVRVMNASIERPIPRENVVEATKDDELGELCEGDPSRLDPIGSPFVVFSMKRMEHLLSFSLLIGISTSLTAQEIQFDPGNWRTDRLEQQQRSVVLLENMERVDSMLVMLVEKFVKDIPNGAYHEFFPNGNIRIKGTLDGYNDDGTLRKTGEWREWDADGIVIREETYE